MSGDVGSTLSILLSDVLPVGAIIALGWLLGRRQLVSQNEARAVNRFALMVAAPPLIFGLMTSVPLDAFEPLVALGYFTAEVAVYAAAFSAARFLAGRTRRESLLIGMCAALVNHVYFVLPVAENLYGASGRAPILSIVTVDSVVVLTGTVILMDTFATGHPSPRAALLGILRMPYVIAIFAGLGWNLFEIPMPEGLRNLTDFVGAAASPAALFAMGVVLSGTAIFARDPLALSVGAIKLVAHPALAALFFTGVFGLAADGYRPALLVAAGPAGSLAMALALHYGVAAITIGRIILLTTLGSVLTLSLLA